MGDRHNAEDADERAETVDRDGERSDAPPPATATAAEKPLVGATEEVEVGGTAGSTSVFARADTGAARTSIDVSLAAEVGAGPITDVASVRSAAAGSDRTRSVVDLVVAIRGNPHVVAASVADRGDMTYPLLLGRDVLEHYRVDPRRRADDVEDEGDA